MSWATCYSGSNNIHFNYPPLMADGRNFASWQPEAVVNQRIQRMEGIRSNWEYRQFLTNNAQTILDMNNKDYCYASGLPCHYDTDSTPSSNVPFLFQGTFDSSRPGFGYCNSDLKNPYLTRQQLNARLSAPHINPNSNV